MSLAAGAGFADAPARHAAWLATVQNEEGMIAWFPGGHADPWNHIEAAMALASAGEIDAAERALAWLVRQQRGDGSFPASFHADGSLREARSDTNAVAYLACGVFHQVVATGSFEPARRYFASVEAAMAFVVASERGDGAIAWSIDEDGTTSGDALLAASSSICLSLGAAGALARLVDADDTSYRAVRDRVASAVAGRPEAFLDKSAFAMDWYYPVLAGIYASAPARRRLAEGREEFVEPGRGVRCRSDGRWVTAAESAECAIAHWRAGEVVCAWELLGSTADLVRADGAVRTGRVYPRGMEFPPGEVTTYSAAAVVLAHDALGGGAAARLFSL